MEFQNKYSRELANSLHVLPFYRPNERLSLLKSCKIFLGSLGIIPKMSLMPFAVLPPYLLSFLPMKFNSFTYRLFAKSCKLSARLLLFIFGFWKIKIEDYRKDKVQSRFVVSNHISIIDYLLMIVSSDDMPAFLCRSDLQKIPFFGRIAKKLQCIFIAKEQNGVSKLLSKCLDFPGPNIAVFPEATTTNGYYVISFKTGAFVPGIAVLPMTFEYQYKNFSPAFESINFSYWLFRMLCEFSHSCKVTLYPLYYPNDLEKRDPVIYAENVQMFIADKLSLPMYATSRSNQLIYNQFLQDKITYGKAYELIYNKDV
eukprot:NODE_4_length_77007_cov_1.156642.p29 type:complete len:313 gc:universal NODE_4_length_77007_cov_1.156642:68706-67768(-)